MATIHLPEGVALTTTIPDDAVHIYTEEAFAFVRDLERATRSRRKELLAKRVEVQARLDEGWRPGFPEETAHIREGVWTVAPIPADLQDRRVEITGPVERKMMINALNSGAKVFMADFEDATTPSWANQTAGHVNLYDAIRGTLSLVTDAGKRYELADETATLLVRPRGWHLDEKHVLVDGEAMSGSLFDFGFYFHSTAKEALARGTGPYFYLPKLESHEEARLWNDVFVMAQEALDIPVGTIKVTVLIETILAAFQMEEILWELKDHMAGLNAGRWDYIFSAIKKFRSTPGFALPDRDQITMTVPFMRAYTELMVRSCHKRGAHAIGGMAAFIPSRRDPAVNEAAIVKVRADKERESADGCDGTWVAHPDLVPVARAVFDEVLGDRPHQKHRMREDVAVTPADLVDFTIAGGTITEAGMRKNITVALLYLDSWLRGNGAAALFNLMEDAATAEISRSQLWQWVHNPAAVLDDGREVTLELYRALVDEELAGIRRSLGDETYSTSKLDTARTILDGLVEPTAYEDFLTTVAYDYID